MVYTFTVIGGFVLSIVVSVLIWFLVPLNLGFSLPYPPYLVTPVTLAICAALAWWNPPDSQPES